MAKYLPCIVTLLLPTATASATNVALNKYERVEVRPQTAADADLGSFDIP